ncbi:FecR family protein [Neorhodopirellula lusitana]|uniref:FecR family protein n=1 Tax=Neorhodopirellula lusitana TaxID=445327 RepID=A0ABY1QIH4_9BACT|nr:DNRLRE domain-containing protein [Neorhodopirellula lusitana]SMP69031.1 FecR family protein [Neorhodopirellula lusitana]
MTSEPHPELSSAELSRLIELASAYRDDRIADADVAELDMMLAESPAALAAFVEMGMLVAELSHTQIGGRAAKADAVHLPKEPPVIGSWVRYLGPLILAASILIATGLWSWESRERDVSFAELESVGNCLWQESATPTHNGQRISVGHFRLAQGVATVRFDNGARVDLEGPSHLEILGKDRCQLHGGKLVVTVENDFKGFTVDTPNGRLIDQGTSFGVTVKEDGDSMLEVFDGFVDVQHRASGEQRRVDDKSAVRLLRQKIANGRGIEPLAPHDDAGDVQVTTIMRKGADCSFRRDYAHRNTESELLFVRTHKTKQDRFDYRSSLRFDLSGMETEDIAKARLQLTATPSGRGFASKATDTTIAVYGILDDALDDWSPETVAWEELLGVQNENNEAGKARLLGHFTIPKGQQAGVFRFEGKALAEFVKHDTNKLISLVLVAKTHSKRGILWNSFASSHHETLRPPTLHMWFEKP